MTHADLDFLAALRKRSADPTLSDMQRLMRMLPDLLHVDEVPQWVIAQNVPHDASPLARMAMGVAE